MTWFPLPASADDIELVARSDLWTPTSIFDLLHGQGVEEWRHKVGVAGALDGSGKSTTRLLAASGWVCKSRMDEVSTTRTIASARLQRVRDRGVGADVWHPSKAWAVMRCHEAWFPLTVCRELVTLRRHESVETRMLAWIDMIQASIDTYRNHALGLDVNPSNFAHEPSRMSRLYYLARLGRDPDDGFSR